MSFSANDRAIWIQFAASALAGRMSTRPNDDLSHETALAAASADLLLKEYKSRLSEHLEQIAIDSGKPSYPTPEFMK